MESLAYRRRLASARFPGAGEIARLAKDSENLAGTLETLATLAAIRLAIRRPAGT